eukprot:CAMPEP_0176261582 /NCGR_PEP_ID=MMETSP0121_2-20121125/40170_1 /TAXON_ID=160619 /ORGANISM="Kryptoperidinium foliaceum, Strain CCMP 1326" /LENGTH=150 /DNA_ID=CAMNT_0017601523 /DNA_START=188 /DNA_END=636 /DNA_ORIENTATION=-
MSLDAQGRGLRLSPVDRPPPALRRPMSGAAEARQAATPSATGRTSGADDSLESVSACAGARPSPLPLPSAAHAAHLGAVLENVLADASLKTAPASSPADYSRAPASAAAAHACSAPWSRPTPPGARAGRGVASLPAGAAVAAARAVLRAA